MNGRAYYNEIDPDAVAALRELIACGAIAAGDVDDRSIKDVTPDDVRGYTQCHFFAGAGIWSVAARSAGWPDSRKLWTGSCPCQPFSQAGQRAGEDDPRHLWPDFHRLISACRPTVVMGEQVAGKAGRNWFYGVRTDLEGCGYAGRAVDIPACSVDAPHERNRLYWIAVANAASAGRDAAAHGGIRGEAQGQWSRDGEPERLYGLHSGDVADTESQHSGRELTQRRSEGRTVDGIADADGTLAIADGGREARRGLFGPTEGHSKDQQWPHDQPRRSNGSWWADAEWITCHDNKARRAKPEIPMLVAGMAGRNSLWRLAGNSISPVLAKEVIAAFLETEAIGAAA